MNHLTSSMGKLINPVSLPITREHLEQLVGLSQVDTYVQASVEHACANASPRNLSLAMVRFFSNYTYWNGKFGSGVASLAGLVGSADELFRSESKLPSTLSDASVFVASFFFDAARDEFNDSSTRVRDTHRCLAQAFMLGMINYVGYSRDDTEAVLKHPDWVRRMANEVRRSYMGDLVLAPEYTERSEDLEERVFAAIGYHVGSELLASHEFTIFDKLLRDRVPELVRYLDTETVNINGNSHVPYSWIKFHSGLGGAVEEDHFNLALEGVNLAFRTLHHNDLEFAYAAFTKGLREFNRQHRNFFEKSLHCDLNQLVIHSTPGR